MRFSHDITYDAPPEAVHTMLADPAFREQVCDAMRVLQHEVTVDGSGTGMRVRVDQTQPAQGIPSFAKKFVGDDIRILQSESWSSGNAASLTIEIPGKPGTFDGAIALAGEGGGTVETVSGEVKVKVPMIGGKLEGLVADMLRSALRAEERVGRRWLTEDH